MPPEILSNNGKKAYIGNGGEAALPPHRPHTVLKSIQKRNIIFSIRPLDISVDF
ncbi:hypothetical protein FACS1894161_3310 [Spirochaetia bacterium]|nr:hypothetical protein FACS1894161_3310 [Spirochaetia bacterium]